MHFVENHKFNISYEIGSTIQHTSQNFSGHDEATGLRVDLNITSQYTDIIKDVPEISKLLITQGFDWRSIYCPKIISIYPLACQ